MAIVMRNNFAKSLLPGINKWFGDGYKDHEVEYAKLFEKTSSKKAYEEDVSISGLGYAVLKDEGDSVSYDDMRQGFVTRYVHLTYALGFQITEEAVEDDLYGVIGKKKAQALARSMRLTKEVNGADIFNSGFDSGVRTGGDGLEFFSDVHVHKAGGTYQNELSTAANLSELSLEQACIDLGDLTDDRGLKIAVRPVSLHIPTELEFDAARILKSIGRVDTANNDINAIRELGKFPGGTHVNHYFTDSNAWFIKTDCMDGAKYMERSPVRFGVDNDVDTTNAKFTARERYSFLWSDPRGYYASPGA